jgi:ABC-type enterochelin transport system permease subunit
MNRPAVGILGCVSLAAAIVLTITVVFFEKAIITAGIPYNFLNYSALAVVLFGLALVCGLNARGTGAGKVALLGGLVFGVLFASFVALLLFAFSTHG